MKMRTVVQYLLICTVVMALAPQLAFAQDQQEEAPLRLVYLNTAERDGQNSFQTIEKILQDTDRIDLMRPRDFWRVAEEFDFDVDTFRQSSEREANIDRFAELMKSAELEGILVHDVFGGGNTMQIVVLGPQGWQLADIRHSIPRGRLDDEGSIEVLHEVFTNLVPEVRGFRREQEEERLRQKELAQQQLEEAEDTSEEEDDELSLQERAIAEHREKYGNLTPNISARVGPLLGHRTMNFSASQGGFAVNHITPLFGVGLRADALITTLDRDTAALEAGAFFGFAPFATLLDGERLAGQYIRAGADIRYLNALSAVSRLRLIAGVETLNISLTPNQQYTGHGYLLGRAGVGIHYAFGSLLTMQLDALLMPILIASNSGGAYGDPEGWLGYGAELSVYLDLFEPVLVSIDYGFQRFETDHPNPQIIEFPAASRDMIHNVMISAGYRF